MTDVVGRLIRKSVFTSSLILSFAIALLRTVFPGCIVEHGRVSCARTPNRKSQLGCKQFWLSICIMLQLFAYSVFCSNPFVTKAFSKHTLQVTLWFFPRIPRIIKVKWFQCENGNYMTLNLHSFTTLPIQSESPSFYPKRVIIRRVTLTLLRFHRLMCMMSNWKSFTRPDKVVTISKIAPGDHILFLSNSQCVAFSYRKKFKTCRLLP